MDRKPTVETALTTQSRRTSCHGQETHSGDCVDNTVKENLVAWTGRESLAQKRLVQQFHCMTYTQKGDSQSTAESALTTQKKTLCLKNKERALTQTDLYNNSVHAVHTKVIKTGIHCGHCIDDTEENPVP